MYNYAIYLQIINKLVTAFSSILQFSGALLIMFSAITVIKNIMIPRR